MIVATLLLATAASAHTATVEHRGRQYDVAHRATTETRAKTIGMSAGTRFSTERCRWSATVRVERSIASANGGAALNTVLPGAQKVEGSHHGPCQRNLVVAEQPKVGEVAARMVAAAQADRAAVVAAIDAAHDVASR